MSFFILTPHKKIFLIKNKLATPERLTSFL
nr:MAG TPA: hypothetical protein [Caudoviricetes sp.]